MRIADNEMIVFKEGTNRDRTRKRKKQLIKMSTGLIIIVMMFAKLVIYQALV